MKELKPFVAGRGIAIDETFHYHASWCAQCATAGDDLALLCLEGSVLWKREHPAPAKKRRKKDDRTFDWIEEVAKADRRK